MKRRCIARASDFVCRKKPIVACAFQRLYGANRCAVDMSVWHVKAAFCRLWRTLSYSSLVDNGARVLAISLGRVE